MYMLLKVYQYIQETILTNPHQLLSALFCLFLYFIFLAIGLEHYFQSILTNLRVDLHSIRGISKIAVTMVLMIFHKHLKGAGPCQ